MSAIHILKRDDLTLGGRLVASLREAILSGSLAPGRHLKDRELCEMFGVSRTLVREAVQALAAEDLIEIVPHRGPVVATLDRRTVAELYRVRGVLEGLACAEFAVNADEAGRSSLSRIVDELGALSGREGAEALVAVKNDFYRCLFEHCGNRVVGQTFTLLNNRITQMRRVTLSRPGRLADTAREIAAIRDAMLARDPETARRLAEDHVQRAARVADEHFQALEASHEKEQS